MPELAPSAVRVPLSRIRELAETAMAMDAAAPDPAGKVLKLYFGESTLPTPEFIQRAAQKAMADGYTFYTENAGMPSTRRALARYYQEHHQVRIDPDDIVITASGVQALHLSIRCVLDPGDEAIVLTPAWPNGSAIIQMSHAVVKQVPQPLEGGRYTVDFDALRAALTPRTRLLLYTSPSNPLGWVATGEEQQRLLDFAREHDLWLLADEVYERLCYSAPIVPSILKRSTRDDAVIVVQSFSKAWCMTGWRLGWMVARRDLARRAGPLNEFLVSHACSFIQRAGETALLSGEDTVRKLVAQLRSHRDFCLRALETMPGVTVPRPEGAFYLFPRIDGCADSFGFCRDLLLEKRVGLAPGAAFGAGGEGSVRLCYAADIEILREAMQRLDAFLRAR